MTDTSGISVCFGNIQDEVLLENAKLALQEMRAKWSDKIQIDTTHFVCTTPAATPSGAQASGSKVEAPGVEYQRALQLSIPVVQPHWILACHAEKKYVLIFLSSKTISFLTSCYYRMIPIASFYLGTNPSASAPYTRPQSMSQANLPHSPTGHSKNAANRASMPAPSRVTSKSPPNSAFVNQPSPDSEPRDRSGRFGPTPEELDGEGQEADANVKRTTSADKEARRRSRPGTMDKNFKFPPTSSPSPPAVPDLPSSNKPDHGDDTGLTSVGVVAPSSVEVPPPPPVEKERVGQAVEEGEEDVGETEEIALN